MCFFVLGCLCCPFVLFFVLFWCWLWGIMTLILDSVHCWYMFYVGVVDVTVFVVAFLLGGGGGMGWGEES